MVTLKSTEITIDTTNIITVFPSVEDAIDWVDDGARRVSTSRYKGVARPVVLPGRYLTTQWRPVEEYVAYIKQYTTPQYHPEIPFPYLAWVVVLDQ